MDNHAIEIIADRSLNEIVDLSLDEIELEYALAGLVKPVDLRPEEPIDFTCYTYSPFEESVLTKASYGFTICETAIVLSATAYNVKHARENIIKKSRAPNMVAAVDTEFESARLRPDIDTARPSVNLGQTEHYDLILAARGLTCAQAGQERNVSTGTIKSSRRAIKDILGALNMPHAIRLAREAGISTRAI